MADIILEHIHVSQVSRQNKCKIKLALACGVKRS